MYLPSRTFVIELFLITSKAKQRCLYLVQTNRTSPNDRCQPIPTEIQREQGLESGGQGFTTFVNQVKHSQKVSNASTQEFYLQNHLCGQQDKPLSTPYLTVHHISLKYTIPYGVPRSSIFRKLNNKSRVHSGFRSKGGIHHYHYENIL